MPKLLLFAPCEKVIIDEISKTVSLITVLEQVEGEIPGDAQGKIVAAMHWSVVTVWLKTQEDEGKTYEQRTCIIQPDGSETLAAAVEFRITERAHRLIHNVFGFPVSQSGEHTLRLALREKGGNELWVAMADFPIRVVRKGAQ